MNNYLNTGDSLIITKEFQTEQEEVGQSYTEKTFPLGSTASIWAITDHWVYVKHNGIIASTPYEIAYRMREVYVLLGGTK